jgi:hypothetical protein
MIDPLTMEIIEMSDETIAESTSISFRAAAKASTNTLDSNVS